MKPMNVSRHYIRLKSSHGLFRENKHDRGVSHSILLGKFNRMLGAKKCYFITTTHEIVAEKLHYILPFEIFTAM